MITATREIGIDAGHRVTNHGSKCRNIHGHRYRVLVTLTGALVEIGEEEGMVMDFGFLKGLMMSVIDDPCDHGMILWAADPLMEVFIPHPDHRTQLQAEVIQQGHFLTAWAGGKLYLLNVVPTAENLARHWCERLQPEVHGMTEGRARVSKVEVWETPNCSVEYIP